MWDLTGHLVTTITHDSPVRSAMFSPDGTKIVTASDDNTAKVMELATLRQLVDDRTRRLGNRTLSPVECATYSISPCPSKRSAGS